MQLGAGFAAATPIPPTYLFCLEMMDAEDPFAMLEALDIDLRRVLHGEQRFVYHAPVVVGDELTLELTVTGVTQKKGGALTLIVVTTRIANQRGEQVADCSASCRSQRGARVMISFPTARTVGASGSTRAFPITRAKLALYAGASGDHNPMHIDSDFAKKAGFPDVFSHGMLVMGLLGQAFTDACPRTACAPSRRVSSRSPSSARHFAARECRGTVRGRRRTARASPSPRRTKRERSSFPAKRGRALNQEVEMNNLAGKVALVSGSGRGIGRASR